MPADFTPEQLALDAKMLVITARANSQNDLVWYVLREPIGTKDTPQPGNIVYSAETSEEVFAWHRRLRLAQEGKVR